MDWLRNLDWGAIILGLFALGFALLMVKAVRKMRSKESTKDDDAPKPRGRGKKLHPMQLRNAEADDVAEGDDDDGEDKRPSKPGKRVVRASKGGRRKKGGSVKGRGGKRRPPRAQAPSEEDTDSASDDAAKKEEERSAEERERLTKGLAATRGGFIARLGKLFAGKPTFDDTMLEQVEEVLFTADIGARTADELIQSIRKGLGKKAATDANAVWQHLKTRSAEMLNASSQAGFEFVFDRATPFVLLMVGVNGTGKTTTIGKLAQRFKAKGKRVLLAAGDTYRAAAAEQLAVWGERAEVEVVRRQEGADPTSVIVEAIKKAKSEGHDVVICDTAGRLQTNVGLMEELAKVNRAIAKQTEGGPHETFLVLDATTGQNAIAQAKTFREAIDISGLVLTKLDGTAKGGVILGIAHELGLPVRFVGIGEQAEDLRVFDPDAFVDALYFREDGSGTNADGGEPS